MEAEDSTYQECLVSIPTVNVDYMADKVDNLEKVSSKLSNYQCFVLIVILSNNNK